MIENTAEFDYLDLLKIFKAGQLINLFPEIRINNVTIDSRKVVKNSLFVALKGEKTDGHDKVMESFEKGTSVCIVDKDWYLTHKNKIDSLPMIVTDNNLEALGLMANYHRSRFNYPVIAIGGSNGKTSTKEMTATVLSQKFKVLKTFENFNNLLGVPLMLLSMSKQYEVAVLELGTNQPGEMFTLGKIVQPTHVLITNIGKEHLEFLTDLDGVEMEETSIFGEVRSDGIAFVNYDDERLKKYGHILNKFITYGTNKDASVVGEIKLDNELRPELKINSGVESIEAKLQTYGTVSAKNAIATVAIASQLGLSAVEIKQGLEAFQPLLFHGYGRMAVEFVNDITIINDCYNSNPSSAMAALENLSALNVNRKKIAILADMRELGESSLDEHKNIIEYASEVADLVMILGEEMNIAFEMFVFKENVICFESKSDIQEFISNMEEPNCIFLVKGSRGMKMEEVVSFIKDDR